MTRTATWNKIGTSIKEANSAAEALEIAHLNYEVVKAPVYLSNGHRIPNVACTKVKGGDKTFGIVGSNYGIVQNADAFSFVDSMIPEGLSFERAVETPDAIYLIAALPDQYILDDGFRPYVIFQNSHCGRSLMKATIAPLRIVCENQFTSTFRNADSKIALRHTATVNDKLAMAEEVFKSSNKYLTEFAAKANKLATTHLTEDQMLDIVDAYFNIEDAETSVRKANTIIRNRQDFMSAYQAPDNANFVGTAWGMMNAFSDFITHRETKKTKTADTSKFINVTFNANLFDKFQQVVMSKV